MCAPALRYAMNTHTHRVKVLRAPINLKQTSSLKVANWMKRERESKNRNSNIAYVFFQFKSFLKSTQKSTFSVVVVGVAAN